MERTEAQKLTVKITDFCFSLKDFDFEIPLNRRLSGKMLVFYGFSGILL